jgi:pimeloyl-ACP methyl ester carboxylesterase
MEATVTITDGASNHAVSRDGTEIGYWTSGDGPPLLLVHGVLGDHSRWEALRPHLVPSFTVHAMDRRGRGASGDAPEYAVEREFEDVAAVVDAVAGAAGAPVAVYGHSGGASFALGAAALSSNVGRLVLYEPAVNTVDLLPPGLLERFDALLAAGEPEAVVETFCREVLHMTDEQVVAYRQQPSWPARVAASYTLPRELRIPPERLFDAERAAAVTVPTLLLEGSESPDGFKAAIGDVAAALSDARVAVLDGQGHTADVLAPELVAERLFAFLGEPHRPSDERIHRAVSADGTEIVGRMHGQGPPLVLLHGRLEDGDSCWGPMLPLLTDRFTCYTPSTRGRGLSGDNPDHAPECLVEDAAAFIDSIGEPVRVFGWSSGAALALAALARSTMGAAAAIYEPSVSEVINEQDGARLRDAVAGMAEMASDGRPAEAARAFLAVVATDDELAAALAAGYEDTWAGYVPVALQEFQQTHLSPSDAPRPTDPSLLAQISAPVLVLHGTQTPLQSLTDGVDHVARYVPDARVREIPGVGHLAPIVQPAPIAEQLIRFFHSAAGTSLCPASRRAGTDQSARAPRGS